MDKNFVEIIAPKIDETDKKLWVEPNCVIIQLAHETKGGPDGQSESLILS